MGRRSVHHLHSWSRRPKTSGRRGRFAPPLEHRAHRRHRRRRRDRQLFHCCMSRWKVFHRERSGSRMPQRYSMGGRRNRGQGGSLVRRLKRAQGNTWHEDRRRSSRFRDVHESFTCDELPRRSMPFSFTKWVHAGVCRMVTETGAHRAQPVALRRGPYRGYHRRRNLRLRFRCRTNFFLLRRW